MLLQVLTCIGCFAVGILITWLFLNAKISVEQSLIKEYKQKIDELEANNEKLNKELDSVQTNKTIAETNYNNANKTTGELREEVNRLTLQIEKSAAQLNETLQKQTKAETELTEANKLI